MVTIKEYRRAESLEEAWQLNQKKSSRIIGGMLWTKMSRRTIQTAIDLSGLGLDTIEETEDEFRIGCMVSLRTLEEHAGMNVYTGGAMKEALRSIVGVQFRNLATVGGSIYGRYGFSDVLTMFQVMDSYVELYRGGIVPLEEFAAAKWDRDVLVSVIVKKTPAVYDYQSVRNSATDFPVLTLAAGKSEDGTIRMAVGARPGRAVVLEDKQQLLKNEDKEAAIRAFSSYAAEQITTGTNLRGTAKYRTHLVRVLVERALRKL